MADIILTGDVDSTSVGTKSSDIAIDDSSGDNTINLGAGDDLLKYYVTANLDSLSQYNGGSGVDTVMLMLNVDQLNAINSTTMLADFNARTSSSFDFSQYDAQLGFHLDLHSVNFEHLVLNRIASATDDVAHTNEDTPINIDVLANDDDSLAEIKVIVAYGTKDEFGNVINNHMSESGVPLVLNPDGTITYDPTVALNALNAGDVAADKFYYELQVTDPNSAAIVSNSVATVNVTVNGLIDYTKVDGTDFGDFLQPGPGNFIINGLGGNDLIFLQGGNSIVTGGAGADTIAINSVPSTFIGSDVIVTNLEITDFDPSQDILAIESAFLLPSGQDLHDVFDVSKVGDDVILSNKLTTQEIILQHLNATHPAFDFFTDPSVQFQ